MNPISTWFGGLDAAVKLTLGIITLVVIGLVLWWVSTFFTAKSELKDIRKTDSRIAAAAKVNDARARARDTAADAAATRNQQQAAALAKDLTRENAVFDDAARAEYYRLLNNALRGAQ